MSLKPAWVAWDTTRNFVSKKNAKNKSIKHQLNEFRCVYVPDICHCSNDTEFFHYPKVFCPMKRHLVTGFLSLWTGFHFLGVCATESHIWILSHSRLPLQRYAVPVSMAPSLLPRAMVTAHCHFFIFHLFLSCGGRTYGSFTLFPVENRTNTNTWIQTTLLLEESDWLLFCFNCMPCP